MLIRRFFSDKNGATAIEYGLIAAVIAVALVSGGAALGNALNDQFTFIGDTIENSLPKD